MADVIIVRGGVGAECRYGSPEYGAHATRND